jgi:hypothetical protein
MFYVSLYLGCGVAVYFVMRLLFHKTGVNPSGLHMMWTWGANRSGDLVAFFCAIILWPLSLLAGLFWWLGEFQYVKEQQRKAKEKAAETWFDNISTTELLARQSKAMEELHATRPSDADALCQTKANGCG